MKGCGSIDNSKGFIKANRAEVPMASNQKHTSKYLCFRFDGKYLNFCDDDPERRQCIHKHNEVTHLFNQWLDGEIHKSELVRDLIERKSHAIHN